jgi:5-methylcytosine-specific restriction endonuclease McrA
MLTNHVFVLNADKSFLNMVHPARARKLLTQEKAAVFRTYPFVIILKKQVLNPTLKEYFLKIDPGSKWTGFAIQCGSDIVFRMEFLHRGMQIRSDLLTRAGFRRGRRSRNLRYRKKRFNKRKPNGWLAPSLMHRVLTVETWIKRFCKFCPIVVIEIEQVKFDMQKLANPEISGIEYQQGTLWGYEIREYLLEKWGRECVYCGVKDVQLEIEHIAPKSKGGSDRVSNLTLACHDCNQRKGNMDISEFLDDRQKLSKILSQAKSPLRDAAAVNSTREAISNIAKQYNNVKNWTGGRTKMNRVKQNLSKGHSIDAACVGESGSNIKILTSQPLLVISKGHGNRQSRKTNEKGFPALITQICQKTGKEIVKRNPDGTVKTIAPKKKYTHIHTGDIVRFKLEKPCMTLGNKKKGIEKKVKVPCGCYTARVKTPTPKGFEVLINNERVSVSTMRSVSFAYRADGYDYKFAHV